MEAYWTTQAAELIKADPDVMSDPWRELLRRYLEQTQPEKAATLAAARQIRVSDPNAFATATAADANAASEVVAAWEGRLSTWHGDALPAPVQKGVELEVNGRTLPVEMPVEDAFALAGRRVRITGVLHSGVKIGRAHV